MSSAKTASVDIEAGVGVGEEEEGDNRPFIGLECWTSESLFISSSLLCGIDCALVARSFASFRTHSLLL